MKEISGLDLKTTDGKLGFCYGEDIFGPSPEIRYLDDIRASLAEPDSDGPEEVYCIAMDVGKECDKEYIISRNLLFGIVTYAKAEDIVIVPPDWVHAAVNANKEKNMTFGAWCVRDYGFNYEDVRRHHGKPDQTIKAEKNHFFR